MILFSKKKTGYAALGLLLSAWLLLEACGEPPETTEEPAVEEPPAPEQIAELKRELSQKDETIAQLKESRDELQNRLLQAFDLMAGDTHWDIAVSYLTRQQKLPKRRPRPSC